MMRPYCAAPALCAIHRRVHAVSVAYAAKRLTSTTGRSAPTSSSSPATSQAPTSSSDSIVTTAPPSKNLRAKDGTLPRNWTDEPTLEDLDRSVPQVDAQFIAELLRRRGLRTPRSSTAAQDSTNASNDDDATGDNTIKRQEGIDETTRNRRDHNASAAPADADGGSDDHRRREANRSAAAEANSNNTNSSGGEYDDNIILIDGRTVGEVTSWGMIEGAKLLPAHDMYAALHLKPNDFLDTFGFDKPDPDRHTLIFYCQYGPRSLMAAQIASWLGYAKVAYLKDGYYEWAKQYNRLVRRMMLHDRVTGNDYKRQTEIYVGRELAYEIAPEFNDAVRREGEAMVALQGRSSGKLQLPVPQEVASIAEKIAKEGDDPLLLAAYAEEAQLTLTESDRRERTALRPAVSRADMQRTALPVTGAALEAPPPPAAEKGRAAPLRPQYVDKLIPQKEYRFKRRGF